MLRVEVTYRPRRTCLAVPASNPRFLVKARELPVDELFLDLEDAVAPAAKEEARLAAVAALRDGGWGASLVAVRVNDATTPWAYRDVIEVVEGAGGLVDVILLPKVSDPAQITWLDTLLTQVEQAVGLEPGGIAIEPRSRTRPGCGPPTTSRRPRPGWPHSCSVPVTSWPVSGCDPSLWAVSRPVTPVEMLITMR
jgi:hypothetical protein